MVDNVMWTVKMANMFSMYLTKILLQLRKWAFRFALGVGSRRMWAGRLTKPTGLRSFGLPLQMVGSERAAGALRLTGLMVSKRTEE